MATRGKTASEQALNRYLKFEALAAKRVHKPVAAMRHTEIVVDGRAMAVTEDAEGIVELHEEHGSATRRG